MFQLDTAGFAGVFGYAWVTVLHLWLRVSFRATLVAANGMVAGWLAVYLLLLRPPRDHPQLPAYQRVPTSERFGTAGAHTERLWPSPSCQSITVQPPS